jgi:hypothetical protein
VTWITKPAPKPPKRVRTRSPLRPRKRMKKYNAKRKGRAFGADRVDEAYLAWIRTMPCAICTVMGIRQSSRTEVEHFVDRSHGGYDNGDTFPTCGDHRQLRHELWGPKKFERYLRQDFRLNLRALCDRLARSYEAEHFPCP